MRDSNGNVRSVLHPIYFAKDYLDTFKPYKGWFYVKRDLKQPYEGWKNLKLGVLEITGRIRQQKDKSFGLGVSGIFRGLTQMVTAPLTWGLRMPLRAIITGVSGGFEIAESRAGFQKWIKPAIDWLGVAYKYNAMIEERNFLRDVLADDERSVEDKGKAQGALDNGQLATSLAIKDMNAQIVIATKLTTIVNAKYQKIKERDQPTQIKGEIPDMQVHRQENDLLSLDGLLAGLSIFARNTSPYVNKTSLHLIKVEKLSNAIGKLTKS